MALDGPIDEFSRAMMNLSLYDKHKNTIPENGGDEALLAALANGPLPAREAAAAAITNLAWSPEIRSRLCAGGAIPSLVLLLGEEDPKASDTAVKALYNLSSTNHAKVPKLQLCMAALVLLNALLARGPCFAGHSHVCIEPIRR